MSLRKIHSKMVDLDLSFLNDMRDDVATLQGRLEQLQRELEGVSQSQLEIINSRIEELRSQLEANKYTHPDTHPATMIVQDENHRFTNDEEKNGWNKAKSDVANIQSEIITIENRLTTLEQDSGSGDGGDIKSLIREVAYLKLKQEASERIEGGSVFGDDMFGNTFGFEFDRYNSSNIAMNEGRMLMALDNGGLKLKTYISSVYNVGGNFFNKSNGRKIAILDNGRIYCIIKDTTVGFALMLSEDNGENWIYLGGYIGLKTPINIVDASIATDGVDIYVCALNFGAKYTIEATYKTRERRWADLSETAFNASLFESCTIGFSRVKKEIHSVFCIKNSNLQPNSANLFYRKSTFDSNGSIKRGSVEVRTSYDNSAYNTESPSICFNIYGFPIIVYQMTTTISSTITSKLLYLYYSGSSWASIKDIHNISNKSQKYPSATSSSYQTVEGVDKVRMYAVWNGYLNSTTESSGILYSYSDEALSWGAPQTTPMTGNFENSQPSINVDDNGKISIIAVDDDNNLHRYEKEVNGTENYNIIPNVRPFNTFVQMPMESSDNSIIPIMMHQDSEIIYIKQVYEIDFIHKLNSTVVYKIPRTNYVGLFVKKIGQLSARAYINGNAMESELINDEYQFVGSLDEEQEIILRLELSRPSIENEENDAVIRIIGGKA